MTHFEGLGSVNDQVTQTFSCCKELSNDNPNKAETDIYFHA